MDRTLGSIIRELRNKKQLSQKEFGKLFALAESTIGMYERDERKPDYGTLEKIADYFGVSINYMFGRADVVSSTNKVRMDSQEFDQSADVLRIFEELRKYPSFLDELATNPEAKVKEIIRLYKMKKMLLEEEEGKF